MEVTITDLKSVIFQGKAKSLILPGEKGTFEILPFHKNILSRLIKGEVIVDGNYFRIRRGIVKAIKNEVAVIVEPEDES